MPKRARPPRAPAPASPSAAPPYSPLQDAGAGGVVIAFEAMEQELRAMIVGRQRTLRDGIHGKHDAALDALLEASRPRGSIDSSAASQAPTERIMQLMGEVEAQVQ